MRLLKTIKDEDIFGKSLGYPIAKKRKAARAIVLDGKTGKIGMVYVSKYDYYKIPGGGVEENENIREALDRECMEEIGRHIEVVEEIGIITEHRERFNLRQDSYCYLAKTISEQLEPNFTKEEKEGGFEIMWLTIDEAIEKQSNCKTEDYEGSFIKIRDLIFLKEAKLVEKL